MDYLVIGILGALGVLLRVFVNRAFPVASFPIATITINLAGSFLIGWLYGLDKGWLSPQLKYALQVGLLGGFTTFSAFSLESLLLWQRGESLIAIAYAILSTTLGIVFAWLGTECVN